MLDLRYVIRKQSIIPKIVAIPLPHSRTMNTPFMLAMTNASALSLSPVFCIRDSMFCVCMRMQQFVLAIELDGPSWMDWMD